MKFSNNMTSRFKNVCRKQKEDGCEVERGPNTQLKLNFLSCLYLKMGGKTRFKKSNFNTR
ncbi:hypothetical protein Hanom_Chr01g00028521 [Helianthus anomalus]